MDFAFSDEQEALREAARRYLTDRFPIERVTSLADGPTGSDPTTWAELERLGWLDPDLGFLDHAVLFEESASALLPAPLFSTLALALPALGSASRPATLAWADADGPRTLRSLVDGAASTTTADAAGRLTGHKVLVPDVGTVDTVVVVARTPDGTSGLYTVEASAAVVTVRSTEDRTRRLGELVLDATPAQLIVGADRASAVLAETRRRALAGLACEAVGVAAHALGMATEHARTREQFGRVIGTYQGVSHQIADSFVALELSRSLAYWASWAVAEAEPTADLASLAAASAAAEASTGVCESAIQVHGGVGFTWEHPLHRFYKRAQWIAGFDGGPSSHRAELAASLFDRVA